MTSLFLCCYFCATGLCQDATRLGDHRGVTLAWLWFLDQALGSRLGVHCKYFFFFLLSILHFTGATKLPHSFALRLWKLRHIVLQTNSIIFTVKKPPPKNRPTITQIYTYTCAPHDFVLLCLPPLYRIVSAVYICFCGDH